MYSSEELLHFVFANDNDNYYCNGLLSLDLHQYLWLKLHERGYGCVYFLELDQEGDDFLISTYGDTHAQAYAPEKARKRLFGSRQKIKNAGLRKWILKQLTARDPGRSVIVFSLKEFCEFFENYEWEDFLEELSRLDKRTGILLLTVPTEAESSKPYFLHSVVFDNLGETGITGLRNASPCDLYGAIYRGKPNRTVFLNAYSTERIHSLLSRLLLEGTRWNIDCGLRDEMEDYLFQWMNNPDLRRLEQRPGAPSPDFRFRDTFEWCRREGNWNRLTSKAMQVEAAGGIRPYLESLGCPFVDPSTETIRVRRASGSYADRCLRLRLSQHKNADGEERERIAQLTEELQQMVRAPLNLEENPTLQQEAESFLSGLQPADDLGDYGTLRRLLYSLRFCVEWIWVPPGSDEESAILDVVGKLHSYVQCSEQHFRLQQNLSQVRIDRTAGRNKLTALTVKKLEAEAEAARRMLSTFEDVVQASIVKLSPLSTATSLSDMARDLDSEIHQLEENAEARAEADKRYWDQAAEDEDEAGEAEPEEEAEQEEDSFDSLFTDADFSINRPLY